MGQAGDECEHGTFSSLEIGGGMVRLTCDDCGEKSDSLSATAQADIDEWSNR